MLLIKLQKKARRSSRTADKPHTIVTMTRLNEALFQVQGEMGRLGFYDEKVYEVDVYLVPFGGFAYGWQKYGEEGDINIPAISLCKFQEMFGYEVVSLGDILRHEYGHAVADMHRGLVRSRRFTQAFGTPHEREGELEYDPEIHISTYAATNMMEDFAENFMYFVRHKGKLPAKFNRPAIAARWDFIRELGEAIEGGRTKW